MLRLGAGDPTWQDSDRRPLSRHTRGKDGNFDAILTTPAYSPDPFAFADTTSA